LKRDPKSRSDKDIKAVRLLKDSQEIDKPVKSKEPALTDNADKRITRVRKPVNYAQLHKTGRLLLLENEQYFVRYFF